jgi:ATP-binding cassette subfamily B protein
LYRQPKILIFDEATSALDINTEKDFMESINSLRRNKTILVVAHRLSTVSECDQLYLFDKGVITSSGEPKDVIAKMKKR